MNDEQLWMMNDDKMMVTTDRSRRASSGSPRHRRRPTSEQRNTAPSSKADEQPAITDPPHPSLKKSNPMAMHRIASQRITIAIAILPHPIQIIQPLPWHCNKTHRIASHHRHRHPIPSHIQPSPIQILSM